MYKEQLNEGDAVRLLVAKRGAKEKFPAGRVGTVVDSLGLNMIKGRAFVVELPIPAPELVGNVTFDTVICYGYELEKLFG